MKTRGLARYMLMSGGILCVLSVTVGCATALGISAQETPLFAAAKKGDVETVRQILDKDGNKSINERDATTDLTPLMAAAEGGHADVVKVLLKYSADPNFATLTNKNEKPVTLSQGKAGPVTIVMTRMKGTTALLLAARNRTPEVVDLLLDAGADMRGGWRNPLVESAREGGWRVVKRLVERGAEVPPYLLHSAAWNGDPETIAYLIDGLHLDVNKGTTEHGQTPLMEAAMLGNAAAVTMLLDKGADVHAKNKVGWTALHFAAGVSYIPLSSAVQSKREVTVALLQHGANPSVKNEKGDTPLDIARKMPPPSEVLPVLEEATRKMQGQTEDGRKAKP